MKKIYVIAALILFTGCHFSSQKKTVSLLMDASGTFNIKLCHLKVLMNGEKISDTIINMNDLHTDFPKLITRFSIDTIKGNLLIVSANSKTAEVDLNKIPLKVINIHIVYDDMTKIQNRVRIADSIATSHKKILDIKRLADSLRVQTPINQQDTVILNIELPATARAFGCRSF